MVVVAVAGCAGNGGTDGARAMRAESQVRVKVTNHNWSDMRIYVASRAGSKSRIGFVTSMTTQELRIPRSAIGAGPVYLVADPIGGEPYVFPAAIDPGPGDWIEFTVQNNLPISTISVWSS